MDREDIRDEVRRLVRDTSSTTTKQRWSNTVINDRLNEVHKEICARALIYRVRATAVNIVSGTAEYDMPTDFIKEEAIYFLNSSSEWRPLVKKTEKELDMYDKNWRDTSGDPSTHYYLRIDKIGLYPNPSVTRNSALRVDYIRVPASFTQDTDVPFGSLAEYYPYHRLVAVETARRCMSDRGQDFINEIATFGVEYEKGLRELIALNNSKNEQTRITNSYERARKCSRRIR